MAVVPFTAKHVGSAPVIEGVIVRSAKNPKGEDAWVSLITAANAHILVVKFKAEECRDEAWLRALKYGKDFADRLGVSFKKKRGSTEDFASA